MSDTVERPQPIGLYKMWGGERLAAVKGLNSSDERGGLLGEVLEVCDLKDLETLNLERPLRYLFKLIDTMKPLSVQVHPDDEYARLHEKSTGKSECWYILRADEDSRIYLGLKPGVKIDDIKQTLKNEGDLSQLMRSYIPKAGDFFIIPAGTVHAIGKGITLAEVQQPSGVTYRFWDWGRIGPDGKPRKLHIREAFDVLTLEDRAEVVREKDIECGTLWAGPGFTVKKQLIGPSVPVELKLKSLSTIFTLEEVTYQNQESQNTLERWGTLFIKKEAQLSLAGKGDREVQCLIIEPQD